MQPSMRNKQLRALVAISGSRTSDKGKRRDSSTITLLDWVLYGNIYMLIDTQAMLFRCEFICYSLVYFSFYCEPQYQLQAREILGHFDFACADV